MSALLEVSDLRVSYGAVVALREVSLTVEAGQTVAILGANGAGKTSMLRAISGLERAQSGTVTHDGADITNQRPERIARRGIAHVPDNRGLFPSLSVADNLRMGLYGAAFEDDEAAFREVFDHFPILEERRTQVAGSMSGGQQQMLTIARALLQKPRLLMLDEMSMGLAPTIVDDLFGIVRQLKADGIAVLLVEQFVGQALAVADRVLVIEQGAVVADGTPGELEGDDLAAAYLGGAEDVALGEIPGPPPDAVEELMTSLGPRELRAMERVAKRRRTTVDQILREAAHEVLEFEGER